VLLGFVKFFVQLIKVFAIVHDSANRRVCSRRYLHQIQTPLFGYLQRSLRRHNSELLIVVGYDAYLASSDSVVDPYVFIDGLTLLKRTE
jgi:hypothetical protein